MNLLAPYVALALLGPGPEPFATLEFESTITQLDVAPRAGLVAVAGESGAVRLVDASTLVVRRSLSVAASPLDLALSADGAWLAIQTEPGKVTVWRLSSEEPAHELALDEGTFAFSAEAAQLVLADLTGSVRRIDLETGEVVASHQFEDRRRVEGVDISRDGRVVAFAVDDG